MIENGECIDIMLTKLGIVNLSCVVTKIDVQWIYQSWGIFTDRKGRQCYESVCQGEGVCLKGGLPRGVVRSAYRKVCLQGGLHLVGVEQTPQVCIKGVGQTPLVVTSSCGNCSGRYASYWNAFLCTLLLAMEDENRESQGGLGNHLNLMIWKKVVVFRVRFSADIWQTFWLKIFSKNEH